MTDVERAAELLRRTAKLLAEIESEVNRLQSDAAAARDRVQEWERRILEILPDEDAPGAAPPPVSLAKAVPSSPEPGASEETQLVYGVETGTVTEQMDAEGTKPLYRLADRDVREAETEAGSVYTVPGASAPEGQPVSRRKPKA